MKNLIVNNVKLEDYFIDDKGNIYNDKKKKIKPWDNQRGYLELDVMIDKTPVRVKVHEVSARVFIGPRPKGKNIIINHKDGNKHNNAKGNLEYITQRANVAHAQEKIKHKEYLSDKKIKSIKNMLTTLSIKEVSDKMGLKYHIVRDIKDGKTYQGGK